jgi:hypothetical protein
MERAKTAVLDASAQTGKLKIASSESIIANNK